MFPGRRAIRLVQRYARTMLAPASRVIHGACLVTMLLCVPWHPAGADNTMRCGTRLVSEGDGKDKVRTLCGEPTSISQAGYVGGPGYYPNYNSGLYRYPYPWPNWTAVPVEIWTYNLGPSKLLRKLRFVGDELDEIQTSGYGY
jgi:hypothetical protein